MFGVDIYSAEVLLPSLAGVAGMTVVMIWSFFKIRDLMNEDPKK